ncbi:MAG: thioredoxin domain-containing protein [Deltaproteobacteria bacterium]|nr:thioredoxin domain-containing protein [Deltaproteobacteria bacterium]
METHGKTPNHLIREKSPYLLQHAWNPVEWYPWGEEALTRAKKEHKIIFLSIGYSTCHWCHVMEKESFENEAIAALLNDNFICIKVDREERPDLDQIYMAAVQAMTGSGGWPLNVFLTPDLKPFAGGTYFPPEDTPWGQIGIETLLTRVADLWRENPETVVENAERLTQAIRNAREKGPSGKISAALSRHAYESIAENYDNLYGGFGPAPKFPQGMTLSFLLRYHHRTGNPTALSMVEKTLQKMAQGGIYDQLGGGFHRYSTDERWLVPHFEKMLYDNALMAQVYLEAFQVTGFEKYSTTAREILDYVLRDMTAPAGGFYSAEDADSEGEEGTFYVWTPKEVEEVLGKQKGSIFNRFYGISPPGNFTKGKSIPNRWIDEASFAKDRKIPLTELRDILLHGKKRLFQARTERVRPRRDDKILTAWNGMMIGALAYAAEVLDEPRYARAGEKSARFIMKNLMEGKDLLRRYRDGEARYPGYLDDYAFFVQGLIELYQATFNPEWITTALSLNRKMVERFYDPKEGGFFFAREEDPTLLTRNKEFHDGAKPAGNAIALLNLLRLAEFTGRKDLRGMAEKTLKGMTAGIKEFPAAFPQSLTALEFLLSSPFEIIVAGSPKNEETHALIQAVTAPFVPNKVVALAGEKKSNLVKTLPFLTGKTSIQGIPAVYICRNHTCQRPLTDPVEVDRAMKNSGMVQGPALRISIGTSSEK